MHSPTPTWHALFRSGQSSSIAPSQLSSRPLQVSGSGDDGVALQSSDRPPVLHTHTPAARHSPAPSKQGFPLSANTVASSMNPLQSSSWPLQDSLTGRPGTALQSTASASAGLHRNVPVASQRPVPTVQTAFNDGHVSSVRPLQSSSTPLHRSAAGVSAVQPTQPWDASQDSSPVQRPKAFSMAQMRLSPAFSARQSQVPDVGTHFRNGLPRASVCRHAYPSGQVPRSGSTTGCNEAGEQSHRQCFRPPVVSATQRSPGTWQARSEAHSWHALWGNSEHDSSDDFQKPVSHVSTTQVGTVGRTLHVIVALGTRPSHDTPHAPQWSKVPYLSVPGALKSSSISPSQFSSRPLHSSALGVGAPHSHFTPAPDSSQVQGWVHV